jgi:hypothetical protein
MKQKFISRNNRINFLPQFQLIYSNKMNTHYIKIYVSLDLLIKISQCKTLVLISLSIYIYMKSSIE